VTGVRFSIPASVTGITETRETSQQERREGFRALISASVTGRSGDRPGATSTTTPLPVLSFGSGYASLVVLYTDNRLWLPV
jgi:hypothetical protein